MGHAQSTLGSLVVMLSLLSRVIEFQGQDTEILSIRAIVPFCCASRCPEMYHDLRRQYYRSGMKKHIGDFFWSMSNVSTSKG